MALQVGSRLGHYDVIALIGETDRGTPTLATKERNDGRARRPPFRTRLRDERGVTLMELLISSAVTIVTLGVAVQVATQVQRAYTAQLDASAVEEEARFALDWIERTLRSAGSNPYAITVSNCPAAGTAFLPLRFDPNGNGLDDDLRINADINEPNGLLGGDVGVCTESDEDVTIAHDPVASTITLRDNNIDPAPVVMTDTAISALLFSYFDVNRAVTANPAAVAFVQVAVTAQAQSPNPQTGNLDTTTLTSEVRLRSR